MIKKILLLATIFYSTISLAQAPTIQWQKCFGGTDIDETYTIKQTTDGGYILAGYTTSNDGDLTGNHFNQDVWVVKISSSGTLEWQKTFGGTNGDVATSIQQTTDGGYILAGITQSTNGDVTTNHGSADVWVIKLSASGILEWQKTLGGTNYEGAYSIQQTIDGGYILAGHTSSNNGDVTNNHGGDDIWVVKLSTVGAVEWKKCLGGAGNEMAYAIQQTTDGGYILTGYTTSANGDITTNHGSSDAWVIKLSVSGLLEWQKTFGGTNEDSAESIKQTIDGGYILSGYTASNDGDVSGNHGDYDAWVLKITALGVLEWQKTLGGTNDEDAYFIQQTTDGGYILAGNTNSIDGDVTGNYGSYDAWVIKLSASGILEWQKTLGGTNDDGVQSIQQTTDGGYIIAGGTKSTDGDVTNNHGSSDVWVVKVGPELATPNFDKKNYIIYPNPTANTLHIQSNQTIDKITITDVTGKKVMEQNTVPNQIDVQNLQQGMYILQVFSGGKTFVEKFVKQ